MIGAIVILVGLAVTVEHVRARLGIFNFMDGWR
jgi:hypothetical protein